MAQAIQITEKLNPKKIHFQKKTKKNFYNKLVYCIKQKKNQL